METGKFIMNITGWVLIALGLLGIISVIAYAGYHMFWLPADYPAPAATQPALLSYGGISPALLLMFPFVLSLLMIGIGRLLRKNARSQDYATVG